MNSPLAEPGILLRMVSSAVEDDRPAGSGAPPSVVAHTLPRDWLLRSGWQAWAAVWFLLDAAATLGRAGAVGAERLPPGLWVAVAVGLGLACVVPRVPRLGITLDVGAASLLLAAAAAGVWQHDTWRVCLQAGAAAWLVATVPAVQRSARASAIVVLGLAACAGVAAAALRPVALVTIGPAGTQACSVAFLLLALLRSGPMPTRPARGVLAVAVCLAVLLWWVAPASLWTDGATAQRLLFGLAAGASLALFGGGPVLPAIGLAVLAAGGAMWLDSRFPAAGDDVTVLLRTPHAVASYDRATQSLLLSVDGEVVDRGGPEHRPAELASTLVQLFARPGDRVLVLGAGTDRLPGLLLASGRHEVEVVDGRGDPAPLRAALRGDGPVRSADLPPPDPRVRRSVRSWRAALAAMADASRQAIVVAEAPHGAMPAQTTVELQQELRRVAGDALVLQAFAFDLVPVDRLRALLGAAVVAHPWNAVLAVGDDAWLVSATASPRWPADDVMRDWGDDPRWIAHAAHVGDVADVRRALHGVVVPAAAHAARSELDPPLAAGARGRRDVLAVLHELLRSEPVEAVADPHSLLLRWLGSRIGVQIASDEIHGLGDGADDVQRAQGIASRFLPVGAPAAPLQAALGLPAADGRPLVDPSLAIRRAHALDPTFGARMPPVLRSLPRALAPRGDLEDLALLPVRDRLAVLCTGPSPLATALRARFGSACARALLDVLAARALSPLEAEALRELADPFVLDAAGRALQGRQALPELLSFWRRDLPMPSAFRASWTGMDLDARLRVVGALGGRTDADSLRVLAEGLESPVLPVRQAAAGALRASVGDRIAYDPEWPRSALNEAADRLRSLHNRAP
jgi:hypothetical protein